MNYVAPEATLAEDIGIIESNTGAATIEETIPPTPTREEITFKRVEEGYEIIKEIEDKEIKRKKAVTNYSTVVNTELKSVVDVTALDLSSICPTDDIDFAAKGLPDPADYGKSVSDVLDVSAIDATNWHLPTPQLATIDPGCFDTSDMYMSSLVDLSSIDMRGFDLPSFDFSFASDWDFPDWMDPSNIDMGDMWDMSDMDLGGIIDLSSVGLPDWDLPEFDMDWDFDVSEEFDALKGIFSDMGSDGDLLGMGALSAAYNGIKCVGATLIDICTPDALGDMLENFSIPGTDGIFDGIKGFVGDLLGDDVDLEEWAKKLDAEGYSDYDILDKIFKELDYDTPVKLPNGLVVTKTEAVGPIMAAFAYLGDDWWWIDKAKTKYNYDLLSRIHPNLLWFIRKEAKYADIVHVTIASRMYRNR